MTARLCIGLLLCLFATPAPRLALPQDAAPGLALLDAWLGEEFTKDGVGGTSIGVVSGAKLVWTRNYGYADMAARRKPTADTAYRIGSVTKQFKIGRAHV